MRQRYLMKVWITIRHILHLIFFSLMAIAMNSCEQVFNPAVDQVDASIVVEGSLSTVASVQQISITWTQPYNGASRYSGLFGAKVYISDDLDKDITFKETTQSGIYNTYPDSTVKGEIGRTYTLHIKTKSGDTYESQPQTIVKCAPIDSVFCEYDAQDVLEENENGQSYEVTFDGIRVEENTKGLYPNHNFYLYSWETYQEFYLGLHVGINVLSAYMHTLLPSRYNKIICTGNADDYANQELQHNRLLFITSADLENFTGSISDSVFTSSTDSIQSTVFEGLIIKLEQKSISDDAYIFWSSVQKQLDASGKLFDPVVSQIQGNISCTSDANKKAYGVFYAYDMAESYAWLYTDKYNNIKSAPLHSMPKLSVDSLTWFLPPDGWVTP